MSLNTIYILKTLYEILTSEKRKNDKYFLKYKMWKNYINIEIQAREKSDMGSSILAQREKTRGSQTGIHCQIQA